MLRAFRDKQLTACGSSMAKREREREKEREREREREIHLRPSRDSCLVKLHVSSSSFVRFSCLRLRFILHPVYLVLYTLYASVRHLLSYFFYLSRCDTIQYTIVFLDCGFYRIIIIAYASFQSFTFGDRF